MEKLGQDCKIYYGAKGGVDGTHEIEHVKNVDLTLSASEIDKTSRANKGWKAKRAGLKEWGVSFEMIYDTADTAWQALNNFFLTGDPFGIAVLDGEDGVGLHGQACITEFTRNEPLDDMVTTKVTLVGADAPTWG